TRVMYRRRQPSMGWDECSTSLTGMGDGTSLQPRPLPTTPASVGILYRAFSGSSPRFMERIRSNEDLPIAAVWNDPIAPSAPQLLLGPNPVRPGQTVRARWIPAPAASPGAAIPGSGTPPASGTAATPALLEVFDIAGRRIIATPLVSEGDLLRATIGPTVTASWPTGVYLVRVRPQAPGARGSGVVQRLVVLR
ncbi:MAG TPA: hypothetical protein VMS88_06070, partial [Terriglobales bacterium]|nr:hypothetical protein [Terriglobales bacterium]